MPEEQFGAAPGAPAASKVLQPENASSGPSGEELFTSDEFRMYVGHDAWLPVAGESPRKKCALLARSSVQLLTNPAPLLSRCRAVPTGLHTRVSVASFPVPAALSLVGEYALETHQPVPCPLRCSPAVSQEDAARVEHLPLLAPQVSSEAGRGARPCSKHSRLASKQGTAMARSHPTLCTCLQ